ENSNPSEKLMLICLEIECHIHLHDFKKGAKTITKAFQIQKNYFNHNYFAILELELSLNLRCQKYQARLENYLTYYNHKQKKNIFKPNQESWALYEAYIYFLTKAKLVDPKKLPDHIKNRRFRMGKFVNEVPLYSKDKQGMNVAILFAQILIFIAERKFDSIIDRIEALRSYRYRHLRKDSEMYRSNIFIRMLETLTDNGFNRERSEWRCRQLHAKLQVPPEELPFKITEIEVIKFETLWELVLGLLPKRAYKN
ncbi:MAG: hypothetical protein KDC44_15275, partial [Phaeodactylibacter sp.]|nr:hypothetical protein [Phaeodactylibacter sp.]